MKRHLVIAGAALAFAFVASGANAQTSVDECGFEHPKQAKQNKLALVTAFVSCGNTGGNTPNDSTEGSPGTPSCSPPETFNEQDGSPPSGWMWDETKGQGSVTIQAAKNKVSNPADPTNKDTADLSVALKLKGVVDAVGPASGTGILSTLSRATLRDRNGTPENHGDDTAMTVIDFPAGFGFTLTSGQANLKTTANALLTAESIPGLPHCTSIELVDLGVNDENGNRFADIGTFLPAK
jgi:hypothetical protein